MSYDFSSIMRGVIWVSYTLYALTLVPQVVTNFMHRSTRGISSATIFIYFSACLADSLYVTLLGLPLALRISAPIAGVVGTILAGQRLYYEPDPRERGRAAALYGATIGIVATLLFISRWYPWHVGNLAGWIGVVLWLICQLPQLYRIQQTRSVKGFNFMCVVLSILGDSITLIGAIAIPLPRQTLFNSLRGLAVSAIYICQFARFHPRPWYKWCTQR